MVGKEAVLRPPASTSDTFSGQVEAEDVMTEPLKLPLKYPWVIPAVQVFQPPKCYSIKNYSTQ